MIALSANGFVRGRSDRVPDVNTENERSLCFLVSFGGFDYVIGGDTIGRRHGSENARVEEAIADFLESEGVEVDVLHVNHHGADNGSDADFLLRLEPEVAIISLGDDNEHDHPNRHALRRLADARIRIYQTNWGTTRRSIHREVRRLQSILHGDIEIRTDGQTYEISTSREFRVDEP
jgi:beta-lactamase superfamily II metal-dependent hydrolase